MLWKLWSVNSGPPWHSTHPALPTNRPRPRKAGSGMAESSPSMYRSNGTLRETMVASKAATARRASSKDGESAPNTSLNRRTYSGICRSRSSAITGSRLPATLPVKADLAWASRLFDSPAQNSLCW